MIKEVNWCESLTIADFSILQKVPEIEPFLVTFSPITIYQINAETSNFQGILLIY